MKKYWNKYTDYLGLTILHPQYFINCFNKDAIETAKRFSAGKDIIDFGCGRMTYKSYLLNSAKSYFGIDHPKESKRYTSPEKPNLICYFENTSLKKNEYHTAIMLEVLEYLDDPSTPEKVLSEINRVVKPGGKLVLTSPFLYPIHDGVIDMNRFSVSKIRNLLKRSGFKKIKVYGQGNFFTFITNSILVYIFKNINKMGTIFKLFFLPIGVLLSIFLNLATLPFLNFKDDDFYINVLAIAEK